MNRKDSFNQFAEDYFNYRTYLPMEIGKKIWELCGEPTTLLDVGCGTGQATFAFSNLVKKLYAIDPGDNLLDYARSHKSNKEFIAWENTSFENFNLKLARFDTILSANAFHWIRPEVGFKKAYDLLTTNGTFALISVKRNLPSDLREKLDSIYRSYSSSFSKSGEVNYPLSSDNSMKYRDLYFKESCIVEKSFKTEFDTDSYIGLMKTMSDHRNLAKDIQKTFFDELRIVLDSYGSFNCEHIVIAKIFNKRSNLS